jgi:hemerythrin superfamily protein
VDVLDLLKQDHQKVSGLIQQVQQVEPDDERVQELSEQIVQELTIHSALEEAMFYPLLRDRAEEAEERVDVFEAFTEHDVVKHLISLLQGRRTNAELFKAELQVLGESVKHHVKEEESTIFTLARELLDDEEREELGEQVQTEKERLMTSGARSRGRKKTTARAGSRGGKKSTSRAGGRKTGGRKTGERKSTGRKTAARKTGGGKKSNGRKSGRRKTR